MILFLFALSHESVGAWELIDWVKFCLIVAGVIAIALVVCRVCGWTVPSWAWQIAAIVAAVFIGILAIKFLAGL